jgi:ABC-type bacteriocin/lantibiotic exporter with double-glycine peptidase domain
VKAIQTQTGNAAAWLAAFICVVTSVGCAAGQPAPQRIAADPGWTVVRDVKLVAAHGESDCGAAALAMVLAHWQPQTPAEDLRRAIGEPDAAEGFQAGHLRDVARDRGLKAFLIQGTVADLEHEILAGRPVIVGVVVTRFGRAYKHFQVVTGINRARDQVLIADPRGWWSPVDVNTLKTEWEPSRQLALVVLP